MKCEICEASTEDLELHYKEKHPNRVLELTKPEPLAEESVPTNHLHEDSSENFAADQDR